jgi:2-polyprenyl-6-methoxyphenol hydroxylase-like FAD-dependent oxidoreductase
VATAQPIDIVWFRLPHLPNDARDAGGIYAGDGQAMVLLDRGTEWQVSYWIPKGTYQSLRSAGLAALRQSVAALAPWLADRTGSLQDWKQTSVLAVESSRIPRWYKPGLLLIGDAAHVMSPVGGVGINLAIQDAVATSNIVGPHLMHGTLHTRDLAGVQRRREWPSRLVQSGQRQMMRQILAAGAIRPGEPLRMPLAARLIQRIPPLRNLRTRLFAYGGLTPERLAQARSQRVAVVPPVAAGSNDSSLFDDVPGPRILAGYAGAGAAPLRSQLLGLQCRQPGRETAGPRVLP